MERKCKRCQGTLKINNKSFCGLVCSRLFLTENGILSTKGVTAWNKGIPMRDSTKLKMRLAKLGSRHPNWKGGITPSVIELRNNSKHLEWTKKVFKRDSFTCQFPFCGMIGGKLEAHHIKKFCDYPELREDVSNGITLCINHHRMIRSYEEDVENLFVGILKAKSYS